MKQLRQTPTNSGDDSKGHSLGLEGDQFFYVIAGLIAGIILLLVCMNSGISPGLSLVIAFFPLPICIGFLVIFKIGKPPRYTADLFQKWFGNKSLTKEKTSLKRTISKHTQGRESNET